MQRDRGGLECLEPGDLPFGEAQLFEDRLHLGFEFGDNQADANYNRIRSLVNEELKNYFRPEFLNRLDEIIVFRQLNREEVKEIAVIMLKEVFGRLTEQGITLEVTEKFKERLVEEGYNPSYGARPLRRAIMRMTHDVGSDDKTSSAFSRRVIHQATGMVLSQLDELDKGAAEAVDKENRDG